MIGETAFSILVLGYFIVSINTTPLPLFTP